MGVITTETLGRSKAGEWECPMCLEHSALLVSVGDRMECYECAEADIEFRSGAFGRIPPIDYFQQTRSAHKDERS